MKATVVEIQSKSYRIMTTPKPYRLIALQFELGLAQGGTEILRLPEHFLGIKTPLELDDVVEVSFCLTEGTLLIPRDHFKEQEQEEEPDPLPPSSIAKKGEKW